MLYSRPESPPPRVPSPPPYVFTPLASPSSRSHRKPSSSSSSSAPSLPPGLQQEKSLLTVRSFEHMSPHKADLEIRHRQPKRTRSALGYTASSLRANSLPEPFIQPLVSQPHHRTLSLASQISSPPSPRSRSPPPPVPPIPSFVLTPADEKSTHPVDQRITPIRFPSLDSLSPSHDLPASVTKPSKKNGLCKSRIASIPCLKLFSLRNSIKSDRL